MAENEFASLGIVVDATQVTPAATKLDSLTAAGTKTEAATTKLTKATRALATAQGAQAGATAKATDALNASQRTATATGEALHKTLSQGIADATGLSSSIKSASASYAVFGQSLQGVSAIAAASTTATVDLAKSHAALSTQAQALGHSIRGATEQLLQGISPTRVLALEMNNLTYAATGPGGLKGAFESLMGGGLGVAIRFAALISPILAIVGSFAFLEYSANKAKEANDKLSDTLQGIGRISGVTVDQVTQASTVAAASANVSISKAQEWATAYATTGKISGDVLTSLTSITKDYAAATGTDTADAVKELGKAFSDPAKGADTLQASLGLLNGTQLAHIKQLQDEGDLLGAQKVLYDQLNKTIDDTALIHLHGLALAWQDVKDFASDAWHSMIIAAGGGTALENLTRAQAQLAASRKAAGSFIDPGEAHQIAFFTQAVNDAQAEVDRLTSSQKKNADQSKANLQSAAGVSLASTIVPEAAAVDGLTVKLNVLSKARASAQQAGESPENIAKLDKAYGIVSDTLGRVNAAYAQYGDQAGINHAIAQLEAQDAATKDKNKKGELQTQISLLKSVSDLTSNENALTKAKDAGLIVASKIDNADKGKIDTAEKQLKETQNQLASTQLLNNAIADGSITVTHANELSKLSGELKSIEAERDNATGSLKAKLTAIINQLTPAYQALNEAQGENALLNAIDAQGDQLDTLAKQLELVSATNKERIVELGLLKAKQDLESGKLGSFNASSPTDEQQKYLDNAKSIAEATANLASAQDTYNQSLTYTKDLLAEINSSANDAANGLADAFGKVGDSIGNMATALTAHSAAQASFAVEQEKINKKAEDGQDVTKEQILLTKKQGDADGRYYTDTLSAAKGFFDKKSAGYKILNTIEGIYSAIRLANNLAEIASEGAVVLAKTASVGPIIAADAAKTSSGVAAGAANIFAELGPWGFPVVAAMLAVMLGLGFGGGSGGSSQPPVDIAKDRQAAQGAGSVLGDPTGKSDSIAKSLDQLAKDTNTDLEYSNQMVSSLKAIQYGIGSLTGLLARQLGVGGLFDTTKLGIGESGGGVGSGIPLVGGLLSSLFGSSSSKTTLLDQGISIGATSVGQAVKGIAASAYQSTQTDSHSSSLFGLISSSSSSTKTSNTPLSSDFTDQIQSIIGGLRSTVLDAAKKLGVEGAQGVIDSFGVNIGSISFKDMTGSQIQDALNAVFSKLGDQITEAAVPQVKALQQVGEGALETLSRLVNEYTAVNDTLSLMGKSFASVGTSSLTARDRLVQMSGGLDDFTSQGKYFVDNFISSAKALVPVQKAVNAELSRLGASFISNKDEFVALVQGIDTSTEAGATLYAALMKVAPAFAKVADATDVIASKRTDLQIKLLQSEGDAIGATALQRQKELDALDASLRPIQLLTYYITDLANKVTNAKSDLVAAANQMANFAKNLKAFRATLDTGALASNDPHRQRQITEAIFKQTAAAARAGDVTALGSLQQVSTDFLSALKNDARTSAEYQDGLASVKDATSASADAAQGQVDLAQQQLDAIDEQTGTLTVINKSVLSVKDAISNLTILTAALQKTQSLDIVKTATEAGQTAAAQQTAAIAQIVQNQAPTAAQTDAISTSVTNAINDLIATVNAPDGRAQQADYDATLSQLDQLASSALNLLHSAGVFAQWNTPTDVPGGNLGSFSVGTNLYSDPRLASTANAFAQMQQQYVALFSQAQQLYASIPGHASGLTKVPYDNYLMRAHEGEAVLTKGEAQIWRAKKSGDSNQALIDEIRMMRDQLKILRPINDAVETTARIIKQVSPNGDALQTEAVS